MARAIRSDLYLIRECNPMAHLVAEEDRPEWLGHGASYHGGQNAYLITGERTLLFDTLSPAATDRILSELDALLDGRDLDYLVVSHPEAPHAGNTFEILDQYPEAELVAPGVGSIHDLYYLEDATKVQPGDTIDLGGYVVEFIRPLLPDHPIHIWMFERTIRSLFTVDWLGYAHTDGECELFADELDGDPAERWDGFHDVIFYWWRWADTAAVFRDIDGLVERYQPAILGPAHGNVIREDIEHHLDEMKLLIGDIRERTFPPAV